MLFVFPVQLRLAAVKLGVFLNGITVVVFFNQLIDRLLSRLKIVLCPAVLGQRKRNYELITAVLHDFDIILNEIKLASRVCPEF